MLEILIVLLTILLFMIIISGIAAIGYIWYDIISNMPKKKGTNHVK